LLNHLFIWYSCRLAGPLSWERIRTTAVESGALAEALDKAS
jgi:hypothetical protein